MARRTFTGHVPSCAGHATPLTAPPLATDTGRPRGIGTRGPAHPRGCLTRRPDGPGLDASHDLSRRCLDNSRAYAGHHHHSRQAARHSCSRNSARCVWQRRGPLPQPCPLRDRHGDPAHLPRSKIDLVSRPARPGRDIHGMVAGHSDTARLATVIDPRLVFRAPRAHHVTHQLVGLASTRDGLQRPRGVRTSPAGEQPDPQMGETRRKQLRYQARPRKPGQRNPARTPGVADPVSGKR